MQFEAFFSGGEEPYNSSIMTGLHVGIILIHCSSTKSLFVMVTNK